MRMLRSIVCVGLALVAIGICAAGPPAAAVPVDARVIVQPMTGKEYPAPAISFIQQDVAALPSLMPVINSYGSSRSSVFDSSRSFAFTSATVDPYQHIDPGIAG